MLRPTVPIVQIPLGGISLAAGFEPLVKDRDIVFTRIPAGDCMNAAFRQHCTGAFISQGVTTVVVGQDNYGQLTGANQPASSIPTRVGTSS